MVFFFKTPEILLQPLEFYAEFQDFIPNQKFLWQTLIFYYTEILL